MKSIAKICLVQGYDKLKLFFYFSQGWLLTLFQMLNACVGFVSLMVRTASVLFHRYFGEAPAACVCTRTSYAYSPPCLSVCNGIRSIVDIVLSVHYHIHVGMPEHDVFGIL